MTDTDKDIVERFMELTVNATFIADENADVLRPKQIERLYAMRDLMEAQATTIEALRNENASLRARVEKLEGALTVIADTWTTNDVGEDEYNEGYEDGLAIVGKIAITALEGAKHD